MITIIITLFTWILALIFPKSKILFLLFLSYMGYVFIQTPIFYNPDYNSYELAYYNQGVFLNTFEKGYSFLQSLSFTKGISFMTFREYLIIGSLFIFAIALMRLTKSPVIVTLLYFCTVFPFDLVQYRNFTMISFVLLGYSFLKCKNINAKLLSFVFIYIGSMFHSSAYIFFIGIIFYFCKVKITKKFFLYSGVCSIIFLSFIQILLKLPLVNAIILQFANVTGRAAVLSEKLGSTFTTGFSYKIIVSYVIWISLCMFFIYYNQKFLTNEKNQKVILYGFFNVLVGLFLMGLAPDYSRIIRNGMLFFYIYVSLLYVEKIEKIEKKKINSVINVILILAIVTSSIVTSNKTWGPIMESNIKYLMHLVPYN